MSVDVLIRRQVVLTSPQMALILALEPICQAAGLWVVCASCAATEGTYSHLVCCNAPTDETWRMDCPCTTRSFRRDALTHTMTPSGDLIPLAETLLQGTGLAVRCPHKKTGCLTTPLTWTDAWDGLTVRCQCWQLDLLAGIYRFRKTTRPPV
jgi:hypothetical protein